MSDLPDPIYKPRPEGFSRGPSVAPAGEFQLHPLDVGKAKSLSEIADEYFFFSLAIPAWFCGMHDGPLTDFAETRSGGVQYFFRVFQARLFDGFYDPDGRDTEFSHLLLATQAEHGKFLTDFLGSIVLTNLDDKEGPIVNKLGVQPIELYDPLLMETAVIPPEVFPRIPVTVFGVDSNLGRVYLEPGWTPRDCPRVIRKPASEQMLRWAQALKGGNNVHATGKQP